MRGQSFAVITPNDTRTTARDEVVDRHLYTTKRQTGRHKNVAGVEWDLFPCVKQRDLGAVMECGLKASGIDGFN